MIENLDPLSSLLCISRVYIIYSISRVYIIYSIYTQGYISLMYMYGMCNVYIYVHKSEKNFMKIVHNTVSTEVYTVFISPRVGSFDQQKYSQQCPQ